MEPEIVKKKRGRRKKIVPEAEITQVVKTVKKTKPNNSINSFYNIEPQQKTVLYPVLYLKCSLSDIEKHVREQTWKTDQFVYDASIPGDIVPYQTSQHFEFIPKEEENAELKTAFQCPHCSASKETFTKNTVEPISTELDNEINMKWKELKWQYYKNNIPSKPVDCFWCTCPFDNNPFFVLQNGATKNTIAHGCFCSAECAVGYMFEHMKWDDSIKMESYQLMNSFYGDKTLTNSIKPAPSPYYLLDKFYGNMSIQEYRNLSRSSKNIILLDKPITRILPEMHEDVDKSFVNTINTKGNYKVKKHSEQPILTNRNAILRDNFKGGIVV